MSFATLLAEDRRLVILRSLSEMPGYQLNEDVLQKGLIHFGHNVSRDLVRADVGYLEEHRLVRVQKLVPQSGELWLVTLTSDGEDVAQGRQHTGVARRRPGG